MENQKEYISANYYNNLLNSYYRKYKNNNKWGNVSFNDLIDDYSISLKIPLNLYDKEEEKEENMSNFKLTKTDYNVGVTVFDNKLTVYGVLSGTLVNKDANPFSTDLMDTSTDISEVYVFKDLKEKEDGNINYTFTKIDPKNALEQLQKVSLNTFTDKIADQVKQSIALFDKVQKHDTLASVISDPDEREKIVKDAPSIISMIETMQEYATLLLDYLKSVKGGISGNMDEFLNTYAFKEHLMLLGERGAGKTYTVSKFLKDKGDVEIEFMGCHNAVEAIDLLGYYIKAPDGSFVWLDGALSAAFRKAQAGKKVALFMDEILRMPSKELNILVAALTPDSEGYFNLRTNRIVNSTDGIGEVELLRVPKENLWVIATTNIGADYDVEEIDIAFQDRFIFVEIELNEDTIKSILSQYCEDSNIIDKLVDFYNKVAMAVESNELANKLNVRHLVKIITYAGSDIKKIKTVATHFAPQICSRNIDGKLNKMDIEVYKEIIKSL